MNVTKRQKKRIFEGWFWQIKLLLPLIILQIFKFQIKNKRIQIFHTSLQKHVRPRNVVFVLHYTRPKCSWVMLGYGSPIWKQIRGVISQTHPITPQLQPSQPVAAQQTAVQSAAAHPASAQTTSSHLVSDQQSSQSRCWLNEQSVLKRIINQ